MAIYSYTFLKTKSNKVYFARITIDICEEDNLDISTSIISEYSNSNPKTHPEWFSAVQDGLYSVIEHCSNYGEVLNKNIRILGVIGSDVDTTVGAVKCAASMVLWKAIGKNTNELSVGFNCDWTVKYY